MLIGHSKWQKQWIEKKKEKKSNFKSAEVPEAFDRKFKVRMFKNGPKGSRKELVLFSVVIVGLEEPVFSWWSRGNNVPPFDQ